MPATAELKRLLEETAELPEAFTAHAVSLDCKSVDNLANWAVDTEEAVTALCEGTDFGTRPNKAKIRSAIGKAKAMVAKLDERAATGLNDEMVDEPLRHEDQQELEERYCSSYGILVIDSDTIGSDILIGRVKREFGRSAPNPYGIGKFKSRAEARGERSKKLERVSATVAMVVDAPAESNLTVKDPFRIL